MRAACARSSAPATSPAARARDQGPDGPPDTAIRRFVDEAAILQRIDHPHVVKVHAIDAEARPPWLVMDLLGGRDLEDTIHVEGRMDPERAARLFADLASGLAAVHAEGIRHRDIKPANLRLGSDGVPRLIDFGIARDASAARQTRAGFVVGTAAYLPPEVFEDEDAQAAQDSEAADVYALGQSLCEVLAGEATHARLQREGTDASLMVRIMRDKLERESLDPRDRGAPVPEPLARIVQQATAREPGDRTQTAAELERQLRAFLAMRESVAEHAPVSRVDFDLLPAVAPPAPPPPAPPPPARRPWFAMGAVGAAGVLGTGAVAAAAVGLLLVGAIALWIFRPPGARPLDPADAVRAAVAELDGPLTNCRRQAGELRVALEVRDRRASRVDVVSSTVDKRTERCVMRILGQAEYPNLPPVTVEVPVILVDAGISPR
ncbi:MAG: serine/threonine-protein kinase [Myxococcota bacterium]